MFALIDCNNFFVSCERLFDPSARALPAVVMSNNDGCIIARSNESKKIGIKMGEPVFECRDILDFFNVKTYSTNFSLYLDISSRIGDLIGSMYSNYERYSIDEIFIDLSNVNIDNYIDWGKKISSKIYREIGIPVGVGIAPTKTLAKLASKIAKKESGVYYISDINDPKVLNFDISDVWGIGRATYKRLGINTVSQFLVLDSKYILSHFGINLLRTWWELKGKVAISITKRDMPKSMMHSRTFKFPIYDFESIFLKLTYFTSSLCSKLREDDLLCSGVGVFLRGKKGNVPKYMYLDLENPTNIDSDLIPVIKQILKTIYSQGVGYKKGGVYFTQIMRRSEYVSIFNHLDMKKQMISKAVDTINSKWDRAVRIASVGKQPAGSFVNKSGEYSTNWSELQTIF